MTADPVLAALGREIVYRPAAGGRLKIVAFFRARHREISWAGQDFGGWDAVAGVAVADVTGPERGDVIAVDGFDYRVRGIQPEAAGRWRLGLERITGGTDEPAPTDVATAAADAVMGAHGRAVELAGRAVRAIWQPQWTEIETLGDQVVEVSRPMLTVLVADRPAAGDVAVIDGQRWRVREPQPTGRGLIRCAVELLDG